MAPSVLAEAYAQLKASQPNLYPRDGAALLGVSEMELVRLGLGGGVMRLRPEWPLLFSLLSERGPFMVMSRNNWAVIENVGYYPEPTFEGSIAVFNKVDPERYYHDLRLYLRGWAHAFAVESQRGGRLLRSIQIFTPWGESVHKIYFTDPAVWPLWEEVVSTLAHSDQSIEGEALQPPPTFEAPSKVPKEAFLRDWAALADTHDFFQLLQRYKLSRLAAMEAVEGVYAWRLSLQQWSYVTQWVIDSQTPIMFFVGNAGIHQIYTGLVHKLSYERGWQNFHGPALTLHLNPAGIGPVFLVEKPTREGPIYSVELFSPQGEEVLWVFGARKPGQAVPSAWLELVAVLREAAHA